MFIEQLDRTRLLITLENEDLSVFELTPKSIDFEKKKTKRLFKQILGLAAVKTGIPLRDKTISVELLPYEGGCFLLATIKNKKRKIYKIKKNHSYFLASFDSADAVLDALKELHRKDNSEFRCSLYSNGGKYFLLFRSIRKLPDSFRIILSEYGTAAACGSLAASHIEENFTLLHRDSAISVIGSLL